MKDIEKIWFWAHTGHYPKWIKDIAFFILEHNGLECTEIYFTNPPIYEFEYKNRKSRHELDSLVCEINGFDLKKYRDFK